MANHDSTLAVTGATGFIGRRLVAALIADGYRVRCLVRDRDRARRLLGPEPELVEIDLERPGAESDLEEALAGCNHAYFLVHLMAGEDNEGYADRERALAEVFARAARAAGVEGVSYLGGLGGNSRHLASRQGTAEALAEHGPPLTYFRAAMVVGPGSESYELLRAIVGKLPVAPAPSWLDNRTQPIGIRDVITYLRLSPSTPEAAGHEVQIGGPEPISHREVIDALAREMGNDPPRWIGVADRIASAGVMAAGAATVTSGDRGVASELAMGLLEETIVTDPSGAEPFGIKPEPLPTVFQRCLDEEERANG